MNRTARRVRLDIAYDGTEFNGWQYQPGQRTVQGVLEETLGRIAGGRPVRLHAAGRTDSGVHAQGQVAHTDLECDLEDASLFHALRAMLDPDVRVTDVTTVDDRFHARFGTLDKTYVYRVDTSAHGDPLRARYSLHVRETLDLDVMARILATLPGRRDWTGFAASSCEKEDRVRTMSIARMARPSHDETVFLFRSDGFLHHMVRNLVGTLVEIGRGRMDAQRVAAMLESNDRNLGGPTAPARGLVLHEVRYRTENE